MHSSPFESAGGAKSTSTFGSKMLVIRLLELSRANIVFDLTRNDRVTSDFHDVPTEELFSEGPKAPCSYSHTSLRPTGCARRFRLRGRAGPAGAWGQSVRLPVCPVVHRLCRCSRDDSGPAHRIGPTLSRPQQAMGETPRKPPVPANPPPQDPVDAVRPSAAEILPLQTLNLFLGQGNLGVRLRRQHAFLHQGGLLHGRPLGAAARHS